MNYDQLIRNRHGRKAADDYFSKFVFEYLAFIAYLQKVKYKHDGKDREVIEKLKNDDYFEKEYINIVNDNPICRSSGEEIIKELNISPIGNVSRSLEARTIGSRDITDGQVSGEIYGLEDRKNMVEFWYSVRNNLFHDGKDASNRRDQLAVEHAYKTLGPLVGIFLKNI